MSRTMLKPAPVKSKPVTTTTDNGLIITAAKREFFLPRKEIDETKIDLDPQNPRYSKPDGTEYTIGELAEKLQSDSKTVDLCRSIENNGLSDPIIVRRQKGGRYLDEEGNRRLTAWRMARHKASLKHGEESPEAMIYANIPAYILPTDMTERHWDVYLGMLHVQGKLIWDKAARAAHIRRLVEADGLSVKEVSDLLGIRESDVAENIKTLDALAEYQTSTEDREASSKFWHIYEFAKLPDTVKTDSGESSLNKEECVPAVNRAIRANAFHHSRDVRNLKTILANPKTRDDFKNHFSETPDPNEDQSGVITALVEKAKDDAPELVDRNIFKLMSSWADQLASNSVEVFSQIRDKPPGSKQEKIFMKLVNSVIGTATAAGIVDKITPILTKLSKTRS